MGCIVECRFQNCDFNATKTEMEAHERECEKRLVQCKSCNERVHIDEQEQHEVGCRIGSFINSQRLAQHGPQDVLGIQPRFEVRHQQAARDPSQHAEELINFLDEVQPELRQQGAPQQDLNRHGANDVRQELDEVFQLEDIEVRRQAPSLGRVLQAAAQTAQAAQGPNQDAEEVIDNEVQPDLQQYNPEHDSNHNHGGLEQDFRYLDEVLNQQALHLLQDNFDGVQPDLHQQDNPEHDLNHNGDQPQPTEPNHHDGQDVHQDLDEVHYQQALHLLQNDPGIQPRSEVQHHHAAPVPIQDAGELIHNEVQPELQQQENLRQDLNHNHGDQPQPTETINHGGQDFRQDVDDLLIVEGRRQALRQHHAHHHGHQPLPIQPHHHGALGVYQDLHGLYQVRNGNIYPIPQNIDGREPRAVPRGPVTYDTVDRLVEYVEAFALGFFERRGYREEFNYQSVQHHFATRNDPYADVPYVDEQGNPIR